MGVNQGVPPPLEIGFWRIMVIFFESILQVHHLYYTYSIETWLRLLTLKTHIRNPYLMGG